MIFRAEINIPTVILGAFRSKTGVKAHLARGPGQLMLCSDKRGQYVVGDFLKADEVEFLFTEGSGRIQICATCRLMTQVCNKIERNMAINV